MNRKTAYFYIAASAALWGIISIFVTILYEAGFSPLQVVAIRAVSAATLLIIYVLIKHPQALAIDWKDSKYFIGTGLFSIVFFNWCLFKAIEVTSISVASILLYTAPAFVTILSRLLFKELFTVKKLISLFTTLVGCTFVIGVLPAFKEPLSFLGLMLGIGSGFFYSLYSIFGKYALKKYKPITVTLYTFLFAAVSVIPFSELWNNFRSFTELKIWAAITGLGFLSTMLAFLLYTKGLAAIESSRAAILATIEPVIASFAGFVIYNEKLSIWQYLGIFLVILAVIIVQESKPLKGSLDNDSINHNQSL